MIMLFRNIERRFFTPFYPSNIDLQKTNKDKSVVTNFRHLTIRIAKNNLAFPLLKDTISVLGSFKCEVL